MTVLAQFRLHLGFLRWVIQSYENIELIILVKGFFSRPSCIRRSVHQGCLLLYVLASAPLLRRLSGIPKELEGGVSVSAYADEIIVSVTKMETLCNVGKVIEVYEKVEGPKINWGISVGLQLGGASLCLQIASADAGRRGHLKCYGFGLVQISK